MADTSDDRAAAPQTGQQQAERRTRRAQPRTDAGGIVLTLPAHRIVPGATIVYDGEDGVVHRLVLPQDAAPGRTVPIAADGQSPRLMLLVSA